jgi:hypothetical protein
MILALWGLERRFFGFLLVAAGLCNFAAVVAWVLSDVVYVLPPTAVNED